MVGRKRELMASTSRRQNKRVLPEVFAQWTLSEKEYEGANDETNRQKMTAMRSQFKIVEEKKTISHCPEIPKRMTNVLD